MRTVTCVCCQHLHERICILQLGTLATQCYFQASESVAVTRSIRAEQDRQFEDSLRIDSQKVWLIIPAH